MLSLCQLPKTLKWRLIFKATKNGFSADNFHKRCDGFEGTLTVINTVDSFIFGGYTEALWSHSDTFKEDMNAFLFSLVNKENSPIKIDCFKKKHDIFCHSDYGPTFGDGHDIFIENKCDKFFNSYLNLGECYRHPKYGYGSVEAESFMGGSIKFQISDIEVYYKE